MEVHLTSDDVRRWKRGEVAPGEVVSIARHLQECAECRAIGEEQWSLRDLTLDLDAIDEHPSIDDLFAYADGTLSKSQRELVASHVIACARCREDVDDRRHVARVPRRGWLRFAVAAAVAAILLIVIAVARIDRRKQIPPMASDTATAPSTTEVPLQPRREYEVEDWNHLVQQARAGAALIAPAILQNLRPQAEPVRGNPPDVVAQQLSPAGVVLTTQRPVFTWPAAKDAQSVVTIFAADRQVMQSPPLTAATWKPPHDLRRGVTYQWEVDVQPPGAEPLIFPAPPAPPARFRVLDEKALREIESARAQHPDDHLLLALLEARAGLDREATAELRLAANGADAETAKRLLAELRTWPQ